MINVVSESGINTGIYGNNHHGINSSPQTDMTVPKKPSPLNNLPESERKIILAIQEGYRTQEKIAKKTGKSHTWVSNNVNSLLRKGYLLEEHLDRRRIYVHNPAIFPNAKRLEDILLEEGVTITRRNGLRAVRNYRRGNKYRATESVALKAYTQ